MPRGHDNRPRSPSSRKPPEGFNERNETLLDAGNEDLDLRAGQHRLEMGRSPRDASSSVNETIARYKKTQAQKFSDQTPEAREARKKAQSMDTPATDAFQSYWDSAGDLPTLDTDAPFGAGDQIKRGGKGNKNKAKKDALDKLNSADDDAALHAETEFFAEADGSRKKKQSHDHSLTEAQPKSEAPLDGETSVKDGTLLHDRGSRLTHERSGQLQHKRSQAKQADSVRRKPSYKDDTAYAPHEPDNAQGTDNTSGRNAIEGIGSVITGDKHSVIEPIDGKHGGIDSDSTPKPSDAGHGSERSSHKKDSKLKFEDDADASIEAPDHTKSRKKMEKAQHKAERSSGKLQTAQDNLPKKRKLRMNKEFDPEKGKMKPRLRFEQEVKTQREHIKGPVVTRPLKAGANAAIGYAHTKVFQVQEENVGVKAAHKGEMLAEGGLRYVHRRIKTAPYRRVEKLQAKTTRLNVNAAYRKALHDNPELRKKPLSRMLQKRRIKRQYAKAARDAGRGGKLAVKGIAKVKVVVSKLAAKTVAALASPKVLLVVGIIALIVILISGLVTACSSVFSGVGQSVAALSYLAEEEDIDDAALFYSELETDLEMLIDNVQTDWPGFDEYRFNIDAIGHNPLMLMAYLTAVHRDFTFAEIEAVLREIFAEQYNLAIVPEVEIRTRTESRIGAGLDRYGNPYTYTYIVEVEYEWHILNVTLTSRPFFEVINERMNSEQRQHYTLLMQSLGLRQIVGSPFDFNWLPFVSSHYGWRVHPINGGKDRHLGIDIAVPTGTPILAAHGGTVTFAGNMGGYGLVVFINDGNGIETRYAHCDTILVSEGQTVEAGDIIATVGSTGDSTGPHLHFEIIRNGRNLNPLFFALIGDGNSVNGAANRPNFGFPGIALDDEQFAALITEAERHLGTPYVWGGSSPAQGFDCSGFVSYVLRAAGIRDVGRLTAQGLYNISTPVSPSDARPGDLVFFHSTFTSYRTVTHVGIYVGNGFMIHTGSNPAGVEYTNINTPFWQRHFFAFGRV